MERTSTQLQKKNPEVLQCLITEVEEKKEGYAETI